MTYILIVEDEIKIAEVLEQYLKKAGYDTKIVTDGISAVDYARDNEPQLILLDVMLPGKDGKAVCREVRAFSQAPILFVTAQVEEIDRLIGLELGADDYICKPFSPREVVARVKANLRRVHKMETANNDTNVEGFEVDDMKHSISLDGEKLPLTPVEYRLLTAFLNPAGRVWSRDQLLNKMYKEYRVVGDRTVDSHVTNLRKKLQAVRPDDECIHSIYGIGYKLEF
ncbi:MAG: response regulator [Litorimonas sp.]